MKYFLISTEMTNNPVPNIIDWHQQIDHRDITPERAGNIPEWTMLALDNGGDIVFTDILSKPGFLVSSMVYDTMRLYDPYVQSKRMVLKDWKTQAEAQYFLPIFPACDCLLPESKFNRDRSNIIHGVIDQEKVKRRPFFKMGGVTNTHIVFRLDVVESILRRGAKGIKLIELEVKEA